MKVAVIGYGKVGMAVFSVLTSMREIDELVLVGRNQTKIQGELTDYLDSLAINREADIKISGGGYEKTAGADIVIYTVGPAVKDPSQGRLELRDGSIQVAKEVSEELNKYNKDAVIIAISNPVDLIAYSLAQFTGRSREKVIGTGTLLDSARLCRIVAEIFDINTRDVSGYVLGEHGSSACIIWSSVKVMGMSLDEYYSAAVGDEVKISREKLLETVRILGYRIYEQKGFTNYGVAASTARIVQAIIHDSNEILPVSVEMNGEYGIEKGIALSLPCMVNKSGATPIDYLKMTDEELESLKASADVIRKALYS
ncbi:MAG: hypothetical protein Q4D99_06400 [Bacillota bacterium]|nr:hypothetical protein [Bacillota bacterium]